MANGDHPFQRVTHITGFTLIEMMLGASVMTVVLVALLGSYFGQSFLNANARNLTAAMNDATRVMEQIRQQNSSSVAGSSCATTTYPSIVPPGNFASWDLWLNAQGKSIRQPNANQFELIAVTCQTENPQVPPLGSEYCPAIGATPQVGAGEWKKQTGVPTPFNPIRVTVAVGWRQYQRGMGQTTTGQSEFIYTPARTTTTTTTPETFAIQGDTNGDGVINSQAMITTLVTCR